MNAWLTVILLIISNTFMTFAWYGHLKWKEAPIFQNKSAW
ncbi:MAG: DMT family protein, partial [Bacteroidota bacterium]